LATPLRIKAKVSGQHRDRTGSPGSIDNELTAEVRSCSRWTFARAPLVEGSYQWTEDWEYDSFKDGKWATLRVTWRERHRRPRIERIEQVGAYWLNTDKRLVELPCFR